MGRTYVYLIALAVLISCTASAGSVNVEHPEQTKSNLIGTFDQVSHGPIRINSNAEFASMAFAEGWQGNGTQANPYVIENYDINGTGYGYCIYVGNTTYYFEIRNCSLHNASGGTSWPYAFDFGLMFNGVQNGSVLNNSILYNSQAGIYFLYTNYSVIFNNTIQFNVIGILNSGGDSGGESNIISNNYVSNNNDTGITIRGRYNVIAENTISYNNNIGLSVYQLYGENHIFHNNFINNTVQAKIPILEKSPKAPTAHNYWDNGYPDGGNYWSNYTGADIYLGPGQNISGSDGIGDTYFIIRTTSDNIDHYPLMEPRSTQQYQSMSSVDEIIPYWWRIGPAVINATASDPDGIANVTLWYRYSLDNYSWSVWDSFDTDEIEPWSWDFGFPSGEGFYQFFSRAVDMTGTGELFKCIKEASCGYNTQLISQVIQIIPYWRNTSPAVINATASNPDGIANVTLWFRHSMDNSTWTNWTFFDTDVSEPWSWDFDFPNSEGMYEFYSRAYNTTGGIEKVKDVSEAGCGYDTQPPVPVSEPPSQYWKNSNRTLFFNFTDNLSGVGSEDLWWRYCSDNISWGNWTFFTTTFNGYWDFTWPDGEGYYEFICIGRDRAGNERSMPASKDLEHGCDTTPPDSSAEPIISYIILAWNVSINATANDPANPGCGIVKSVELWYRYSADNNTWDNWVINGTDNSSPWSWNLYFLNGSGYYEFFTRAYDVAGTCNYEDAPAGYDTSCYCGYIFNTTSPSQVDDLLATPHQPTANDIQLEWTNPVFATSFNIYRSTSVRGTGFNFAVPYATTTSGVGKTIWVDTGAYADSSNYSWVVRAVGAGGENTTEPTAGGNMGFKLMYTMFRGTGSVTPDTNYISLPYRFNISNNDVASLRADIRTYGSPAIAISSVARWNSNTGLWEIRTAGGPNFPLKPAEGYRIAMAVGYNTCTYKMVGAYNRSVITNMIRGTGPTTPDLNYISLPYHYTFFSNDATGLRSDIRTNGVPVSGIVSVARWNSNTGLWEIRTGAGTNFALTPGEGYRIAMATGVNAVTWNCPVATPGA